MIIGKLDRKLKLYKRTFTNNTYGEREVNTSSFVTIYGSFDFKSGNSTYDADALINKQTIECLVRYRTDIGISPQFAITFGNTVYSIKSIKEVGRKDKLILTLLETNSIDLAV
jgi:SPP1 family predicted phage head-tail adaptor